MKCIIARLIASFSVIYSLAGAGLAAAADKPTMTFYADEWCPYNCTPNTPTDGYLMEMMRQIFPEYQLNYQVAPWPRAVVLVKSKPQDVAALLATTKDDTPDMAFPAVSQGRLTYAFYRSSAGKSDWQFTDVNALKGLKLGVINDYTYGIDSHKNNLDDYVKAQVGKTVTRVSGNAPLAKLVGMLDAGRLDLIIDDTNVVTFTLASLKLKAPIREAGILNQKDVYVAFQPKHPDAQKLADRISRETIAMRKDGRLAKILAKYRLKDWEAAPAK